MKARLALIHSLLSPQLVQIFHHDTTQFIEKKYSDNHALQICFMLSAKLALDQGTTRRLCCASLPSTVDNTRVIFPCRPIWDHHVAAGPRAQAVGDRRFAGASRGGPPRVCIGQRAWGVLRWENIFQRNCRCLFFIFFCFLKKKKKSNLHKEAAGCFNENCLKLQEPQPQGCIYKMTQKLHFQVASPRGRYNKHI